MLIEQENDMNFKIYNLHLNTCKKKKNQHIISSKSNIQVMYFPYYNWSLYDKNRCLICLY